MAEYVTAAIRKGLHTIIFLEHLEVAVRTNRRTWLSRYDFKEYFATGAQLQQQYSGRIRIILGVEIGWNPHAVDEIEKLLRTFPWQWRGLSYHFYWDGCRHLNLVSNNPEDLKQLAAIGSEQILDHYFQQIINAHQQLPCQVICHLDAALRHLPQTSLTANHNNLLEILFRKMAANGTRLEVNTSGLALRKTPFPAPRIIQHALSHGISLHPGSDAHHPDQVGRFFELLPGLISGSS